MMPYDENKSNIINDINQSQLLTVKGYALERMKKANSICEVHAMKFAIDRINSILESYPEN